MAETEESHMLGKYLVFLCSAVSLAALPAAARAQGLDGGAQGAAPREGVKQGIEGRQDSARQSSSDTYGDRNRGGPYGFYSYPSHRHVDGGGSGGALDRSFSSLGAGTSPYYDGTHGSAYYGRDYGAPYFGGGYYDRGTYYRERRD
jgi:hypothetical protein